MEHLGERPHLTSEDFDEVRGELAKALDHFGAPQREKEEFLAAIVSQKQDVVNA